MKIATGEGAVSVTQIEPFAANPLIHQQLDS